MNKPPSPPPPFYFNKNEQKNDFYNYRPQPFFIPDSLKRFMRYLSMFETPKYMNSRVTNFDVGNMFFNDLQKAFEGTIDATLRDGENIVDITSQIYDANLLPLLTKIPTYNWGIDPLKFKDDKRFWNFLLQEYRVQFGYSKQERYENIRRRFEDVLLSLIDIFNINYFLGQAVNMPDPHDLTGNGDNQYLFKYLGWKK
jgi:hypothetical protein